MNKIFPAAFLLLGTVTAGAQPAPAPYKQNEITVGLGNGVAFERDLFNVDNDQKAEPDLAINLAFTHALDPFWNVGLHYYGYNQKFPYYVEESDGTHRFSFTLHTSNVGLRAQRYFSRTNIRPYAYGVVNYAYGVVSADTAGSLKYSGFSFGGGGGLLCVLTPHFGVSVDGLLSLGNAKWKELPFTNSTSRSFHPSYGAVTGNLVFML